MRAVQSDLVNAAQRGSCCSGEAGACAVARPRVSGHKHVPVAVTQLTTAASCVHNKSSTACYRMSPQIPPAPKACSCRCAPAGRRGAGCEPGRR
jgi:hypothetical protein